jgi:hypothetical protein
MSRVHRNLDGYLKNYPGAAPMHYKPCPLILDLDRKWLADTKVLAYNSPGPCTLKVFTAAI